MTETTKLPVTALLMEDHPADQAMARRTLTHEGFEEIRRRRYIP
ncbi:MAG: hypothetical protein O2820_14915 [Planctomycetota bacterium]|nr:hypothetical protein [Planctomycetota bacterium]MDA1250506.1 hypothetical protein [Planctomycetota bacterium]